jgi:hypothetical protein
VHHGCPRNEYYEFKASAHKPSDLGCLMENLGCKGTQAHADCNTRLWNGSGSCLRGGFACIACTEPGFEEPGHPFAGNAQGRRHPHRPADGHAQGLVRRPGGAVEIGDAETGARQRRRRPRRGQAGDPQDGVASDANNDFSAPSTASKAISKSALDVDAGQVAAAYVNSPLYRGFEEMLIGRRRSMRW